MGTINQPTPSNPKSPQPDPQPLQPGGPTESRQSAPESSRPNFQTPDTQHEQFRDEEK